MGGIMSFKHIGRKRLEREREREREKGNFLFNCI
jgi:hypothetical protein